MNADQAFDNLAKRNELVIPVARNAADSGTPGISEIPRAPIRAGTAIRVDDLPNGKPGDYHPRRGHESGMESERRMYNHPTETDLEPTDTTTDTEELDNADSGGARIADRGIPVESAGYREANEVIEDGGRLDLADARRVQRFAYLPLQGMEDFEAVTRGMIAKLAAGHRDRPSIAITSAMRGEGRTELAIRLALAISKRVGARILLVDFDLRKPGVAARLGISSKYFTIVDVLRGSCRLGDALVASDEENLYVLPARANDREGDEILDSRQTETVMADMHEAFDFIVIDCPPVLYADAMIVCHLAGCTALAGMCGFSLAGRMNQAAARLEEAGARMAGMLLTGA